MSGDLSIFSKAADEAAKPDLRAGMWKVWESYEVVEIDGGAYVLARGNANNCDEYRPLAQTPGLYLEFARLADEGEITREVWLDWVERYGVLGLEWRNPNEVMLVGLFGPVCQEGGPNESYEAFVREARRANWVLRLVEVVGSPEGPDYAEFIKEAYEVRGVPFQGQARQMSIDGAKRWALRMIWQEVQEQIRECHPVVHVADGRFMQGWGFHSLISAMYLQLMWLLTATGDEVRWCKRPECGKVIAYEQPEQAMAFSGLKKNDRSMGYRTRKDKEFCSNRCKGLYHYYHVKKGKRRKNG